MISQMWLIVMNWISMNLTISLRWWTEKFKSPRKNRNQVKTLDRATMYLTSFKDQEALTLLTMYNWKLQLTTSTTTNKFHWKTFLFSTRTKQAMLLGLFQHQKGTITEIMVWIHKILPQDEDLHQTITKFWPKNKAITTIERQVKNMKQNTIILARSSKLTANMKITLPKTYQLTNTKYLQ